MVLAKNQRDFQWERAGLFGEAGRQPTRISEFVKIPILPLRCHSPDGLETVYFQEEMMCVRQHLLDAPAGRVRIHPAETMTCVRSRTIIY